MNEWIKTILLISFTTILAVLVITWISGYSEKEVVNVCREEFDVNNLDAIIIESEGNYRAEYLDFGNFSAGNLQYQYAYQKENKTYFRVGNLMYYLKLNGNTLTIGLYPSIMERELKKIEEDV